MIKFNYYNNYGSLSFKPKGQLKKVVRALKKLEQIKEKHVVSFILVTDQAIQEINSRYRNKDQATDVISFANIDSNEGHALPYDLGDIFISIDRAKEQAERFNQTIIREFSFLATHGLLHLFGYDHLNASDEDIMIRKQKHIMKKIGLEKEV